MSKYNRLRNFLQKQDKNAITLSFGEIEEILHSGLPNSAFRYSSWWANSPKYTPQSRAWGAAGYTVVCTQLGKNGFVIFRKPGTGFWERLFFGNWDCRQ